MRARTAFPAALAVAALIQAAPAAAQDAPLTVDTILSSVVVFPPAEREPVLMSDYELSEERGGFFSKDWAMQINFGATLSTYINGKVAMATQFTLSNAGLTKTTTVGAAESTPAAQTSSATSSSNQTATNSNNTIAGAQEPAAAPPSGSLAQQAAAAGITLNDALKSDSWTGTVVQGDGGGTAVLQSADMDRIAQVVLNTANGVNVQQKTDITLAIPGFAELQQGFMSDQLKSSLQSAMASAAIGAALRH